MSVFKKIMGENFLSFTHHNISARWWTAYVHSAFKGEGVNEQKLSVEISKLLNNDAKGPQLRANIPDCLSIEAPFLLEPACKRIVNYSGLTANQIQHNQCSLTFTNGTLTQEDSATFVTEQFEPHNFL